MHPYMIRSFKPFFKEGNALELGCGGGNFTLWLIHYFGDITALDCREEAIRAAEMNIGCAVKFIHAPIETASLPARYDNIIMTHVLEHVDDPVAVLRRIQVEWLTDAGRLFLVCPNANAASRRIAVKMGLIADPEAVTEAEAGHGHKRTYTQDALARDAESAGLRVLHRSGIFFKALANFQWDRIIDGEIIDQAYLDGCYELGKEYPDLCASIFLVCEKGVR